MKRVLSALFSPTVFAVVCSYVVLVAPAQAMHLHVHHGAAVSHKATPVKLTVTEHQLSAMEAAAWIAFRARFVATKTNTIGWCFKSVKWALKPFGIKLDGGEAWMAQEQLSSDDRFMKASLDDLKAGDILVHGKSVEHPFGHIAVYLGNSEEASDHVQALVSGESYGGTMIFRLKSNVSFLSYRNAFRGRSA